MSPTTSLLRSETSDNEVFLLGTAHISEASANEVIQLIDLVKPKKVFIELDPSRAARLRASEGNEQDDEEELFRKAFQQIMSRRKMGIPGDANMLKTMFRGFYGVLKRYGYLPGIEMLAAMKQADTIGATLDYGDRDVNDTLRELSASLSPSLFMKAVAYPPPSELQQIMQSAFRGDFGDTLEALKTREHARMMRDWMDQAMPPVAEVMLHRRDRIMAENLRRRCGEGKVVAVVGLAHLDGIEREWQKLG